MDVVIIGAGAAGLMAAIHASGGSDRVYLVEKNEKVGRKIMITGKGRCNVTNNCDIDTLIKNTTKNARFLYSAFSAFSPEDTMDFFETQGVLLKTERGNRVFPQSDKAVDIVDALYNKVKKNGCKMVHGSVSDIVCEDGAVSGVKLADGSFISAQKVVLATGGCSYPLTGSTGDGYVLAKKLGHTVTPLVPSLVPIYLHEGFCSEISGLSLKNVVLKIMKKGVKKPVFSELGEMLFTHFGVSGPLVLSASAHMRDKEISDYSLFIDFKPALTFEQLDKRICRDFSENPNKDISNVLGLLLPQSMILPVLKKSGIDGHTKINQVTREQRAALEDALKNFKLTPTRFADISQAIVTSGGISVKEIDPKTMQSRLVRGLFFAGEIIDVDAYTGGFNLQIAFSTGYLAGGNDYDSNSN